MQTEQLAIVKSPGLSQYRLLQLYQIVKLIGSILTLILVLVAHNDFSYYVSFYSDLNDNWQQGIVTDIQVVEGRLECADGYQIAASFAYSGTSDQCVCYNGNQTIQDGQCSQSQIQSNCLQQTVAEQENLDHWINVDQATIKFCIKRLTGLSPFTNSTGQNGCQQSYKLCGNLGQELSICVPSSENCPIYNIYIVSQKQSNLEQISFGKTSYLQINRMPGDTLPITDFLISSDCKDSGWFQCNNLYDSRYIAFDSITQDQLFVANDMSIQAQDQVASSSWSMNVRPYIMWNKNCRIQPLLQIIHFKQYFQDLSSLQFRLYTCTFITFVMSVFLFVIYLIIIRTQMGQYLVIFTVSQIFILLWLQLACIVIVILCLMMDKQVLSSTQNVIQAQCTDQYTQNQIIGSRAQLNDWVYIHDIFYALIYFISFLSDLVIFVILLRINKSATKGQKIKVENPIPHLVEDASTLPQENVRRFESGTPKMNQDQLQQQVAQGPFQFDYAQIQYQNPILNSHLQSNNMSSHKLKPLDIQKSVQALSASQTSLKAMTAKPYSVRQQSNSNKITDELNNQYIIAFQIYKDIETIIICDVTQTQIKKQYVKRLTKPRHSR